MSTLDFDRYEDSDVNWRVRDGYGAVIAKHGEGLPVHVRLRRCGASTIAASD